MRYRLKYLCFLFFLFAQGVFAQGYNHVWLMGNAWLITEPKGRMLFDSTSYSYSQEYRAMTFYDTQGNISDANGNFLMSSNGVSITNHNNQTMLNGGGLNPNNFTSSWSHGLVIANGNVFLPFPNDTTKYILVHQTGDSLNNVPSTELYYSVIDMTLDSGLGGVTSKNNIIFHDTLSWGLGACRHANGRDWWVVAVKDSTDLIYKILFTSNGVISMSSQHLGFTPVGYGNTTQIKFSENGDKFVTATYDNPVNKNSSIVIADFDRCSGTFSNTNTIHLSSGSYLWGQAFSPNGNFVYACTSGLIFQVNTNTLQIDTVAIYDGFYYPIPNAATTFNLMYLAANGKIYVTPGGSAQYIHEMNFPDSADTACNLQQHAIFLDIWHFRSVPNHPNYYLGRLVGSPCDTVQWTGIKEPENDFRFRVYPNPVTSNSLHIGYLLPQNKSGLFQLIDVNGKIVFKYLLPQWSIEQQLKLPQLANGIYNATIISDNQRVSKTIAIIRE